MDDLHLHQIVVSKGDGQFNSEKIHFRAFLYCPVMPYFNNMNRKRGRLWQHSRSIVIAVVTVGGHCAVKSPIQWALSLSEWV